MGGGRPPGLEVFSSRAAAWPTCATSVSSATPFASVSRPPPTPTRSSPAPSSPTCSRRPTTRWCSANRAARASRCGVPARRATLSWTKPTRTSGHRKTANAWFAWTQGVAADAVVTLMLDDGIPDVTHDAVVAPILFGVPALAAAAETVDVVVHDATVAPILFGVPALAAAAETVDVVVHDATVAPILFGVPALAAAAETVDAVVHDATVAPILFGAPTLTVAAAAETVAAPAFEGFLAPDGDRVLIGSAGAAQRLADALRIQRGSYPFLRDLRLHAGADRRPAVRRAAFAAVAEALIHPANGLDDIRAARSPGVARRRRDGRRRGARGVAAGPGGGVDAQSPFGSSCSPRHDDAHRPVPPVSPRGARPAAVGRRGARGAARLAGHAARLGGHAQRVRPGVAPDADLGGARGACCGSRWPTRWRRGRSPTPPARTWTTSASRTTRWSRLGGEDDDRYRERLVRRVRALCRRAERPLV